MLPEIGRAALVVPPSCEPISPLKPVECNRAKSPSWMLRRGIAGRHLCCETDSGLRQQRHLCLVQAQPSGEDRLEGGAVLCGQLSYQALLVGDVLSEGEVDALQTGGRQGDDPAAAIMRCRAPLDQTRVDETINPLGHRPRGNHRALSQFPRGALVRRARSTQCREHIELPLPQAMTGVHGHELVGEVRCKPVESTDDALGCNVEVRAFTSPLLLDLRYPIDTLSHVNILPSTEDIMSSVEAKWRWLLVAAIAPVAWGSNYFVTRQFLPEDAPLWGAALRALPAGILLMLVRPRLPHGSWWWKSPVLGVLNVGAFFVLIYVASQLLPSNVASTIMATSVAVLMLLAWPLLAERPTVNAAIGAVIGFAGVGLLLLQGSATVNPWGVAASLAAMLMSSTGFILTKRWSPSDSIIAITSWQLLAGGLLLLPFALLFEGAPPALDAPAIAGFAYVTVVATALAFVAWFTALRRLPAGTVGLIGLLNPLTGVLLGTTLAAEPFGPRQALGTGMVLVGVLVGQRHRTLRREP